MLRSARSTVTARSGGLGSAGGSVMSHTAPSPSSQRGTTTLSGSGGAGSLASAVSASGVAASPSATAAPTPGFGSSASSSATDQMHPNLGLHNAAASGDVGLVKYALDNGQPHTSVLNGVLPLHAACSGGSEAVVRLLIAYGADVNAPRLKRKGSTLGPGTEGSTPLHFAAANGHVGVVRVLLEHGARPGTPDRDGLHAENLASANGHAGSLSLLRSWTATHGPNGLSGALPGPSNGPGTASSASLSPSNAASSNAALRSQRSFEQITSAAAGVKASLLNRRNNSSMAKVNSNPNLKQGYSPEQLPPPPLPSQTPLQQQQQAQQQQQHQWPSSPTINLTPVRSASPHSASDTEDLGFSSGMTLPAAPPPGSASPLPAHLLPSSKESRRRPSLPSIFEKAAHPAASIRAALGGGGGGTSGGAGAGGGGSNAAQSGASMFASMGGPDMIEELSDARARLGSSNNNGSGAGGGGGGGGQNNASSVVPPSPNRMTQRITGKRSLSNMLRKATGGGGGGGGGGSASSSSDSPAPALPTLSPSRSRFDEATATGSAGMGSSFSTDSFGRIYSQQSLASLDAASVGGGGGNERLSSAPPTQASFHLPPSPSPYGYASTTSSSSNAALSASPEQRHPGLRSTASSSALQQRFDVIIPPFPRREGRRRARSSSNNSIQPRPSLDAATNSEPVLRSAGAGAGKVSPTSLALQQPPGSAGSQGTVVAQSQTQHDYRPRKSSNLSSGTTPMMRVADSDVAVTGTDGAASSARAADAGKAASGRRRAQSTADATSASLSASPRRALLAVSSSGASSTQQRTAAPGSDDALEFLGDAPPTRQLSDAAGEHHDSHRLPDRLRCAAATRSPRSSRAPLGAAGSGGSNEELGTRDSKGAATAAAAAGVGGGAGGQTQQGSNPPSPSFFGHARLPRHGSSSSLSGTSSSSAHLGVGVGVSQAALNLPDHALSPHLSPRRYIDSTPEEGAAAGGGRNVQTRTERSGSMASKASSTSLSSVQQQQQQQPATSALEQAQAILRQADVLGSAAASADGVVGATSAKAEGTNDAAPVSLAQMLAAYGEALALERKASSLSAANNANANASAASASASTQQVRRQSSLASVSERPLARVSEHAGAKVIPPPPAALALSRSGANSSASTPPASPARFTAKSSSGGERVPCLPATETQGKRTASAEERGEGRSRKNSSVARYEDHSKTSSPMSSNLSLPGGGGSAALKMSGGSMDSGRQHMQFNTSMTAPPRAALVGRASEDLLRSGRYTAYQQSPSVSSTPGPTAPSTPLMEGRFAPPGFGGGGYASPLSAPAHRHSPSLPTEFSYGRSSGALLSSNLAHSTTTTGLSVAQTPQTVDGHSMGEGKFQLQQAQAMLSSTLSAAQLQDEQPFNALAYTTPISRSASNAPGSSRGTGTGARPTPRSGSDISAATFLLPAPDFDPYASPALSSAQSSAGGGGGKEYAESVGSTKGKRSRAIKSFLTSIKR